MTDCWTRKTLSAVRSLGKAGYEVHTISHTLLAPSIWSKYATKHYIFPFPEEKPQEYLLKLIELLKSTEFDCIYPMDEAATKIILQNRTEIEQYTMLPLPDISVFDQANDKWAVLCLAKELHIPIPISFLPTTPNEIQNVITQLGFPLIIKARSSSGSRGVKRIETQADFDKHYPFIQQKYGNPILQQCIQWEGQGVGVGLLAKDGETLVHFSYKRLREYPVKGGPSTLRESTKQNDIIEYSHKLISKLGWHGVAMVEYKTDPTDGIPKLMEINPRFWGSLQLAQASGINFPDLLYRMMQNETISQPEYTSAIRCRWLIPGDIVHFISNSKRFSLQPSFFSFFDKNTFFDQYDKEDKRGNIAVVLCTFLSIFNLRTWIMGIFRR